MLVLEADLRGLSRQFKEAGGREIKTGFTQYTVCYPLYKRKNILNRQFIQLPFHCHWLTKRQGISLIMGFKSKAHDSQRD